MSPTLHHDRNMESYSRWRCQENKVNTNVIKSHEHFCFWHFCFWHTILLWTYWPGLPLFEHLCDFQTLNISIGSMVRCASSPSEPLDVAREAGLPTLTVLPWVSRFQCKSHGLTATQGNFTGSPLCRVNIYKCYSNDASDADFLLQGTILKCGLIGVGNGHRILLTADEGCVSMTLNHAYTSCASNTG